MIYIDYGNTYTVAQDDLKPFPPEKVNVAAMAWQCKLAFIQAPNLDAEYGVDAARYLHDAVMGRDDLVVEIVSSVGGLLQVIVFEHGAEPSTRASINCRMLETGCTRTVGGRDARDMPDVFKESEKRAAKNHLALWEYGDSRGDSDEEDRRPQHWNARR